MDVSLAVVIINLSLYFSSITAFTAVTRYFYRSQPVFYHLDEVFCQGNESYLIDCKQSSFNLTFCSSYGLITNISCKSKFSNI